MNSCLGHSYTDVGYSRCRSQSHLGGFSHPIRFEVADYYRYEATTKKCLSGDVKQGLSLMHRDLAHGSQLAQDFRHVFHELLFGVRFQRIARAE